MIDLRTLQIVLTCVQTTKQQRLKLIKERDQILLDRIQEANELPDWVETTNDHTYYSLETEEEER